MCVCVVQDGRADVVANDAGDRVTPAVVAYRDTEQVQCASLQLARYIAMATNETANNCVLKIFFIHAV